MAKKHLPQAERLLSGTLSALISDVATTMTVSNPPASSRLPTFIELDPDSSADREVVRAVSVSGSVVTIERGVYTAGVGKQHIQNAPYKEKITQKHWDAVVDAIETGFIFEDAAFTFTQNSSTVFRINGVDQTTYYTVGKRVRLNGSVLVTVVSSTYSGGNTVVTVVETTVPASITSVELEIGGAGVDPSSFPSVTTDTINEKTAAAGVTADGVLLKDGVVTGGLTAGDGKTIDASHTNATLKIPQGASQAPTAEGSVGWDTDDNRLKVGDGAAPKTFIPDTDKNIAISFLIDGGGSVPSTGVKGGIQIPFACTIDQAEIAADASGDAVVDIWKDTYANYPPVVGDSIVASAKPTLSSAIKNTDSTLTGWTTTIAAGDYLLFNLDSVATCKWILVTLRVKRT